VTFNLQPKYPIFPKFGFVSHNQAVVASPAGKLALFCTMVHRYNIHGAPIRFSGPAAQLALFRTTGSPMWRGHLGLVLFRGLALFRTTGPPPPEIGFVSHDRPGS
jgi:hypothetical protein